MVEAGGDESSVWVTIYRPVVIVDTPEGKWFANVSNGVTTVQVTEWPLQAQRFDSIVSRGAASGTEDPQLHVDIYTADSDGAFLAGQGKRFAELYIPFSKVRQEATGGIVRGWFGLQREASRGDGAVNAEEQYELTVALAANLLTPKICCTVATSAVAKCEDVDVPWQTALRRAIAQHGSIVARIHAQLRTLWTQGRLQCSENSSGERLATLEFVDPAINWTPRLSDASGRRSENDGLSRHRTPSKDEEDLDEPTSAWEHVERLSNEVASLTEALTRVTMELEDSERMASRFLEQRDRLRTRVVKFGGNVDDLEDIDESREASREDHFDMRETDAGEGDSVGTGARANSVMVQLRAELRRTQADVARERAMKEDMQKRLSSTRMEQTPTNGTDAKALSHPSLQPSSPSTSVGGDPADGHEDERRIIQRVSAMYQGLLQGLETSDREQKRDIERMRRQHDEDVRTGMKHEAKISVLREHLREHTAARTDICQTAMVAKTSTEPGHTALVVGREVEIAAETTDGDSFEPNVYERARGRAASGVASGWPERDASTTALLASAQAERDRLAGALQEAQELSKRLEHHVELDRDAMSAELQEALSNGAGLERRLEAVEEQAVRREGSLEQKAAEREAEMMEEILREKGAARRLQLTHEADRLEMERLAQMAACGHWVCPQCGKINDFATEVCWNCRGDKPLSDNSQAIAASELEAARQRLEVAETRESRLEQDVHDLEEENSYFMQKSQQQLQEMTLLQEQLRGELLGVKHQHQAAERDATQGAAVLLEERNRLRHELEAERANVAQTIAEAARSIILPDDASKSDSRFGEEVVRIYKHNEMLVEELSRKDTKSLASQDLLLAKIQALTALVETADSRSQRERIEHAKDVDRLQARTKNRIEDLESQLSRGESSRVVLLRELSRLHGTHERFVERISAVGNGCSQLDDTGGVGCAGDAEDALLEARNLRTSAEEILHEAQTVAASQQLTASASSAIVRQKDAAQGRRLEREVETLREQKCSLETQLRNRTEFAELDKKLRTQLQEQLRRMQEVYATVVSQRGSTAVASPPPPELGAMRLREQLQEVDREKAALLIQNQKLEGQLQTVLSSEENNAQLDPSAAKQMVFLYKQNQRLRSEVARLAAAVRARGIGGSAAAAAAAAVSGCAASSMGGPPSTCNDSEPGTPSVCSLLPVEIPEGQRAHISGLESAGSSLAGPSSGLASTAASLSAPSGPGLSAGAAALATMQAYREAQQVARFHAAGGISPGESVAGSASVGGSVTAPATPATPAMAMVASPVSSITDPSRQLRDAAAALHLQVASHARAASGGGGSFSDPTRVRRLQSDNSAGVAALQRASGHQSSSIGRSRQPGLAGAALERGASLEDPRGGGDVRVAVVGVEVPVAPARSPATEGVGGSGTQSSQDASVGRVATAAQARPQARETTRRLRVPAGVSPRKEAGWGTVQAAAVTGQATGASPAGQPPRFPLRNGSGALGGSPPSPGAPMGAPGSSAGSAVAPALKVSGASTISVPRSAALGLAKGSTQDPISATSSAASLAGPQRDEQDGSIRWRG